ncbi:MAG: hypothetical protein U0Z17_00050 [Bacteroidales bacterium]
MRQQVFIYFGECFAANKLEQVTALTDIFIKLENGIFAAADGADAQPAGFGERQVNALDIADFQIFDLFFYQAFYQGKVFGNFRNKKLVGFLSKNLVEDVASGAFQPCSINFS